MAPAAPRGRPASYNNEGVILREQGKAAPAIEAFEKALALDPNLASALWNLSDLLFSRQNDLDRSDDLLVKAFARGLPDGTKFLIGRAIGYQRAGQADRALKLLNAAVQAQPADADVLLFRGRYRVDAGQCAAAIGDFQKSRAAGAQGRGRLRVRRQWPGCAREIAPGQGRRLPDRCSSIRISRTSATS